jgi:hypothetical protein
MHNISTIYIVLLMNLGTDVVKLELVVDVQAMSVYRVGLQNWIGFDQRL